MKPGLLILALFVFGLGCFEGEGEDLGFDAATVDIRPRIDAWSRLERPDAGPLKGAYEDGGRPKPEIKFSVVPAPHATPRGAVPATLPNAPMAVLPAAPQQG